jgi:hypothetical protein
MNPDLSLSGKSVDYFSETFIRFIFEKCSFDFWKVKNNYQDYDGWPEALKMDHFLETAWNANGNDQ